jgi:ubiquinone/menaquinone biosynthesis C-methylase UbiE
VRPLEGGRRRAVGLLAPETGDRILIPACGTGADLRHLPGGASIVALDAVPAMARRASARGRALGIGADTLVGDARSLPFADDMFDAVLLHLVLSVVPDPEAVVAETARVLAPDGRVSIYDKFVEEGERPSLARRALEPVARLLFSSLTRRLEPMLQGTGLRVTARDHVLGGLYTSALARADGPSG